METSLVRRVIPVESERGVMVEPFAARARRRSPVWIAVAAVGMTGTAGFVADHVLSSWGACGDGLDGKAQRSYQSRNVRLIEEIAAATATQTNDFVHRTYRQQDRTDPPVTGVTTLARVSVPGGLTPERFGTGQRPFVTDITDRLRRAGWDARDLGTAASYPGSSASTPTTRGAG